MSPGVPAVKVEGLGVVAHFLVWPDLGVPDVQAQCTKKGGYVQLRSGEVGGPEELKQLFGEEAPSTLTTTFLACVPLTQQDLKGGLPIRVNWTK
jgi:hypothetical protein